MALQPRCARSPLTRLAWQAALEAHDGQVRKVVGEPFVNHPARVASILWLHGASDVEIAAAFLHDSVEDTSWTLTDVAERCGGAVASLVADLSEDKSLPYARRKDEHLERLRWAQAASKRIFAADKFDNCRDIRTCLKVEGTELAKRFNAPLEHKIEHMRAEAAMLTEAPGVPVALREALTGEIDALQATLDRVRALESAPGSAR